MLDEIRSFLKDKAFVVANDAICEYKQHAAVVLLAGIFLKLAELVRTSHSGDNTFEITAYTLGLDPVKILTKGINGRTRFVAVWVESATGGPTPTIRIGKTSTSANGGGMRVSAGQVNEIGNVPANVELYGAASTVIVVYVLESA